MGFRPGFAARIAWVETPKRPAILFSQSPHWTVYVVALPVATGACVADVVGAEVGTAVGWVTVGAVVVGKTGVATAVGTVVVIAAAVGMVAPPPGVVDEGVVTSCATAPVGVGSTTGGFSRVHAAAPIITNRMDANVNNCFIANLLIRFGVAGLQSLS